MIDSRVHRLLVRHCDVYAPQPKARQGAHGIQQLVGMNREAAVVAVYVQLVEPETMDQRRLRMRNRPADHARDGGFDCRRDVSAPRVRRYSSRSEERRVGKESVSSCESRWG